MCIVVCVWERDEGYIGMSFEGESESEGCVGCASELVCGCGLEVLILSLVVVSCTWPCKK